MPKLFTKIANNINGLAKVYNDSPTSDKILNNIQSLASANPVDEKLVNNDVLRIEPIYALYVGDYALSKTEAQFKSNSLQLGATVRRKRLSDFYNYFPSSNSLIPAANNGRTDSGTLVEIKPYGKGVVDTDKMKQDSRKVPLVSGPRDEQRLGGFLKTNPGILFLAMQQTLQGGNTFKQARRYNPASVLVAAGKYTLASLTNPLERVDRALNVNTDNAGRLQQETILSTQGALKLKFTGGQSKGSSRNTLLGNVINTAASRFVQDLLNRTNVNIRGKKINLGQLGRTINTYAQTLNSIVRSIGIGNATITKDQTAYDALIKENLWPLVKERQEITRNYHREKDAYVTAAQNNISSIVNKQGKLHTNYFTAPYPEDDYRGSATYTDDIRADKKNVGKSNGILSAKYIKDPMNYTPNNKILTAITDINGKYDDVDFINFKIVVPDVFDGGINFRAFLKDIKHNAKGEYEEQRYVGRPERFIVYKGMTRSMTFSLYLVAFSEDELSGMWLRANMLNKLVYPISTVAGHMTPPIIKMTIGDIISEQPGYITDISMDFADSPWDVDRELTNVILLNVTFNIIEKNYITQASTMANIFAEQTIQERIDGPGGSTRGKRTFDQLMQNTNNAINSANDAIAKAFAPVATTSTDSQVTQDQFGQMQYVPPE